MDLRQTGSRVLVLAAIYNIVWGASVIFFPHALFDWAGLARPAYPEIWQCVGMIVGVYGVGYWVASWDPARHWPIVLVGFMGKIFGPIGFIDAFARGVFNPKFGLTLIFNDLIWWVPFFLILREVFMLHRGSWKSSKVGLEELHLRGGERVVDASEGHPIHFLLVRHKGCTFCREELDRLSKYLKANQDAPRIVVVHMSSEASGREMQESFGLQDVEFISDPEKRYYRAFGARVGSLGEVLGPKVWVKGVTAFLKGYGVGGLEGDGFQLGGLYRVEGRSVTELHRPENAADVTRWSEVISQELAHGA